MGKADGAPRGFARRCSPAAPAIQAPPGDNAQTGRVAAAMAGKWAPAQHDGCPHKANRRDRIRHACLFAFLFWSAARRRGRHPLAAQPPGALRTSPQKRGSSFVQGRGGFAGTGRGTAGAFPCGAFCGCPHNSAVPGAARNARTPAGRRRTGNARRSPTGALRTGAPGGWRGLTRRRTQAAAWCTARAPAGRTARGRSICTRCPFAAGAASGGGFRAPAPLPPG